jgi:hypothetical protein
MLPPPPPGPKSTDFDFRVPVRASVGALVRASVRVDKNCLFLQLGLDGTLGDKI